MLKNLIARFIGKQIGEKIGLSKTKLVAIVYIIVNAVPIISQAWGHPVEVPAVILRMLEAAGLWSLRSAFPDNK